jgi:hypothetical protein
MSFYCRDADWSDDESDADFDSMHKHENIHILKSYIDVILVSDISSMHAYPQKCPYNTKQTQIHMAPHPIV